MVAAADAQNYAQKLGISHGMVVQELGWDEDSDDDLRADVEDRSATKCWTKIRTRWSTLWCSGGATATETSSML